MRQIQSARGHCSSDDAGAASANSALRDNQSDFNGELAGAILAYIEEVNIAKEKGAYNKIKDWTDQSHLLGPQDADRLVSGAEFAALHPGRQLA